MRNPGIMFVVLASAVAIITQSCGKEDGGNRTNISQSGSTRSHNMGRNCMDCHTPGGEGDGWFTAAGTAYMISDSNSTALNPVVELYSQPDSLGNQVLIATINGDAKGNFYTTGAINFGTGLYPAVVGTHTTKYMPNPITQGACNSCHGATTARIMTN